MDTSDLSQRRRAAPCRLQAARRAPHDRHPSAPRPAPRADSTTAAPATWPPSAPSWTRCPAVYERYGFEPLDTARLRICRRPGQVPARHRPSQRGRLRPAGRRRAVDGPALRPDRAAGPLRGRRTGRPCPSRSAATPSGTVWRNEKPGPGRFREFIQCDADTVGSARPEADAEIIAMAVEGLEAAGLPRRRGGPEDQQPQAPRTACWPPPGVDGRGPEARRPARHRQARPPGRGRRVACCWARAPGRDRRLHQGRGPGRRRPRPCWPSPPPASAAAGTTAGR